MNTREAKPRPNKNKTMTIPPPFEPVIFTRERGIEKLSDNNLISSLKELNNTETKTIAAILLHLIEIDSRKLYLELGYSSLFNFCCRALKYSEAAAIRRIYSARCIRDFPEVYQMLLAKELSLSTIAILKGVLTKENKDEILKFSPGKSRAEIDCLVASLRPKKVSKDSIKPVVIQKRMQPMKGAQSVGPLFPTKIVVTDPCDGAMDSSEKKTLIQEPVDTRFEVKFSVSGKVMKKLRTVQALRTHKAQEKQNLESLLDELMELYLDKNSPRRKIERREKRVAKKKEIKITKINNMPVVLASEPLKPKAVKNSRYLSPAVRDAVFKRDQGRCTFVAVDGTRCNSEWQVETDHIQPVCLGGGSNIDNLHLLCKHHNLHAAEKVLGKEFMKQFR